MDSYEYYLLYHEKISEFSLLFNENNQEILVALSKLLKNGKIAEDREVFFNKLIEFVLNDIHSNFYLDELLDQLITRDLFMSLKKFLTQQELTFPLLRLAKVLIDFALNHSFIDDDIQQFCGLLVDNIYKESTTHDFMIGILHTVINKNEQLKSFILTKILTKSIQCSDSFGIQNLCYFYKNICHKDLTHDRSSLLEKYFRDDSIAIKKQGIFMVKCLLEYNLLDDAENWSNFIVIFETLEENQSHLVLPSLELLYEIKFDESFEKFWFILCTMVIMHENNLIKRFGLNYIFGIEKKTFSKDQILVILQALNATNLYDPNEKNFIENVQNFVIFNSHMVFELIMEVNWFSVPFYYVLKPFRNVEIEYDPNSIKMKNFLENFEKQASVIPKRIRNIKIRHFVKKLYADMLERIVPIIDLRLTLPIIYNVFHINKDNDCLDKCINHIRRDDYELIFCDKYNHEFLKYLLHKTHIGRNLDEIKSSVSRIENNRKLVIEVLLTFNELFDGYEDIPDTLIHESIESIWTHLLDKRPVDLVRSIELLQIGLKSIKGSMEDEASDHLTEIWTKLNTLCQEDEGFISSYLKLTSIVLNYIKKFDTKFVEKDIFSTKFIQHDLMTLIECQTFVLRNEFYSSAIDHINYTEIIFDNITTLLDKSSSQSEIFGIFEILKVLCSTLSYECLTQDQKIYKKFKNIFKVLIATSSSIIIMSEDFWKSFIELFWSFLAKNLRKKVFEFAIDSVSESDQFYLHSAIFNFMKEFQLVQAENGITEFFKQCLVKSMYNVNVLSRDEQIETALISSEEPVMNQRINFRLRIAQLLLENFSSDFNSIVNKKIIELMVISKQKVRYYPNSMIHRQKLRYFQPLVFCNKLEKNVIDVLVYELLWINNQLNIIYMLEIILALHYPDILNLLNHKSKELNTQGLKSIFTIAVMQIRAEKCFEKAQIMLERIFKSVLPYSMGQNFGVRIHSLLAIFLSYEHVKSLDDFKETPVTMKICEICDIILESVNQKNCLKYFNALKKDFRFAKDLKELNNYQVFYRDIPTVTKMPFEEIIDDGSQKIEDFFAADVPKESDCIIMNEEIEFNSIERTNISSVNLQRKYFPLKNQMPIENILKNLPARFGLSNDDEGILNSKSDLILVASLIDNNTNLGGLARTCEIFGVSKYVIHSLKSQENFEFKTLSRTSEKWIKITEIKDWQLFDYLLVMKQSGYSIAGAEQSSNSVSLLNAKFPKKCVFLLGNERKGIPANLLALLDIVIEIPQMGVVRSLNVHVAGALIMWEYAKQHTFNG